MLVELAALRLSIFGWSLVLAWLCGNRAIDNHTGPSRPMHPLTGISLIAFASVMALSNIIGYFAPVVDNVLFADFISQHPVSRAFGMVGMLICIAILVDRLAYSRRYKAQWELGWFVFVHVMIWGRQWVAG